MKLIKLFLFYFLKNIYLFPSKLLYQIKKKNKISFSFNKRQKFLIDKNTELESILNDIERYYLLNNKNQIDEIINKKCLEGGYYTSVEDLLSKDLDSKLRNLLENNNFINYLSNFFGYQLKFNSFTIRLNFFNHNLPEEEGPKMWHRDNDSFFGQIKLFSVINKLDLESGGHFNFIPQSIIKDYQYVKNSIKNNKLSISEQKSRIMNSEMTKIKNVKENIIKFGSNKSEFLAVDTNDTYHKGGFISKDNNLRLLLQVIYEPSFSPLSNYNSSYSKSFFIFHTKNLFTGLKNRLRTQLKI